MFLIPAQTRCKLLDACVHSSEETYILGYIEV